MFFVRIGSDVLAQSDAVCEVTIHRRARAIISIACLLALCPARVTRESLIATAQSHASSATTTFQAPPVHQLKLENGLQVLWEEDHRQPLVAIEARILGGVRGEGPYLGSGVTHFLEHMIFKGTTTRPTGSIDQEVRRYGGSINAFTSHDFTGVSLFVESRYTKDALEMLADILRNSTFPDAEFAKEREVVISEIHMNLDDPERRLNHLFWATHYFVHPYRHPILGYQEQLERLTPEDMRTYYHTQYVPNNIHVAIVGDLDPATCPDMIKHAFGAWPRGKPYQIVVPEEPLALSPREATEELPIQASYVMLGFPSTRLASHDLYPLDVLSNIVGRGRSSRLYETLVRTRRVAHVVAASNYTPMDPGIFTIFLRTDPPQTEAAVNTAVEVLGAVAQGGVTPDELAKAKRQVVADYVFGHQTVESVANDLASSYGLTGDPNFSERYVAGVEGVTAADVQRVAATYLDFSRMTRVTIQPTGALAAPPASAPSAPIRVKKTVLPNGLTLVTGTTHRLPMTVIIVAARGGVRAETPQTQGLSNLVAQMLLKGTSHRSASQIAAYVESLGGQLDAFSGRDGFGLALQLLSDDTSRGLELIHDLLTDSTFPDDELALQRQLILRELDANDDDIFDQGSRLLRRTLFTAHPYQFDPLGTKDTVKRLTKPECLAFAKTRLAATNMVITVMGDLDEAQILEEIRQRFGTLDPSKTAWPATLPEDPLEHVRQASLTLPKEQSVIMLGFRGTRLTAPDRDTLDVLTTILSGMSGRLFQAVRERQGLSYAVGASNVPGWDPGYLVVYAATRPGEREQVLKTIHEQLQLIVKQNVTEDELLLAKRTLIGSYRLDMQSLGGLAKRCALDELYGLSYDNWTSYEQRINAVTIPMVHTAAQHYLQLSKRAEIVVAPDQQHEPHVAANGR